MLSLCVDLMTGNVGCTAHDRLASAKRPLDWSNSSHRLLSHYKFRLIGKRSRAHLIADVFVRHSFA